MFACRLSVWLLLLLSTAAEATQRYKHRRHLPSTLPTKPKEGIINIAKQAPLLPSNRRLLQGDPVADARAIGGALGKAVNEASNAILDAFASKASPAGALAPAFARALKPWPRPAPSPQGLPVGAPAQATAAATIAAPALHPAFAPASSPATEGPSGADKWAEVADSSTAAAGSTQALYAMQVPQLADMHSSASLIDHSKNLALLDHLQVQHVLEASKLSFQHAMDKVWANVKASFDIVKDLPEEIASFPHDVAEDLATAGSTFEEEAFNATYALDAFDHFRHQLEDPVAVETSASVFSFSPCFFHADVGALEAFATGINVGASVLSVSPSGLTIQPQALSITPTLLSVGASGVNVQPDGLNISPSLIAVTPGRVSVNAKGGGISPVGLSVTAP